MCFKRNGPVECIVSCGVIASCRQILLMGLCRLYASWSAVGCTHRRLSWQSPVCAHLVETVWRGRSEHHCQVVGSVTVVWFTTETDSQSWWWCWLMMTVSVTRIDDECWQWQWWWSTVVMIDGNEDWRRWLMVDDECCQWQWWWWRWWLMINDKCWQW